MIDAFDTESSRNNHGKIWNTKRNHGAWKRYLGKIYGTSDIPKYASPSLENDYQGLPAAYTFVQDDEPFYTETLEYIDRLKEAGIHASLDVYHGDVHAFDLLLPWTKKAKAARKKQVRVEVKEMKFRPKIDVGDYETKKNHVMRFLRKGARVKITIMFRGREMAHPEQGLNVLERLAEDLKPYATVESQPKMEGRNMHMLVAPIKGAFDEKAEEGDVENEKEN
jgi:translation initiation factor IF-3